MREYYFIKIDMIEPTKINTMNAKTKTPTSQIPVINVPLQEDKTIEIKPIINLKKELERIFK